MEDVSPLISTRKPSLGSTTFIIFSYGLDCDCGGYITSQTPPPMRTTMTRTADTISIMILRLFFWRLSILVAYVTLHCFIKNKKSQTTLFFVQCCRAQPKTTESPA